MREEKLGAFQDPPWLYVKLIKPLEALYESYIGTEKVIKDSTDGIRGAPSKEKSMRVCRDVVLREILRGRFKTPLCAVRAFVGAHISSRRLSWH